MKLFGYGSSHWMMSTRQQYERIPYPCYVHPLTDPARLAAVGKCFGLNPSPPQNWRVLDIGCGSGTNLLTMAGRFPDARFLGMDFSSPDIAAAKSIANQASMGNIEFQQADLTEWSPAGVKFDLIIAYGFYSWVDERLKHRLLEICRDHLAENGIACISYMTYPGSAELQSIRQLLQWKTKDLHTPTETAGEMRRTLEFLRQSWSVLPGMSHVRNSIATVEQLLVKPASFLLHDTLGAIRSPEYFLEFAARAERHGLQYLAESEYPLMMIDNLPPSCAASLGEMKLERLQEEQMIDHIIHRSFRCSLLCKAEQKISPTMDVAALTALCFSMGQNSPDLVETESLLESFLLELELRPGAFTHWGELLTSSENRLGRTTSESERMRLAAAVLKLVRQRRVKISAISFIPVREISRSPELTPLNQALARHRGLLTTAFQDSIELDFIQRAACLRMNGHHTRREIGLCEDLLLGLAAAGCFRN